MKKQIFASAILVFSYNLQAQDKEHNIDEVEVFGKFSKMPYQKINENVEIISRRDIAFFPAKSIGEILQQFTGMDIRRRGANGVQSDVSVRGSSFEQVLVLINGIRMNDSQTGHNSLNIPVDLANVERIEIIKGPAAIRFGNNAYAGVINIVTIPHADENVKISTEGGDFQTYSLGLSSNFGTEKFSNLIQANSESSSGYRHNTDYKINSVFYQNQFQLKNGKVGLQAGMQEKKFGANGFYASPLATEQYEETQASIVAVNHQRNFKNFTLNSNVYWRRGQDMYVYLRDKPSVYRNMHIGNNVGGEMNGSYKSVLGTTGLGVEWRKEFLVSNNLGTRQRSVSQVYLEHHFSLIKNKLQISPGISWANFSSEGHFFYPGIDAGFDLNPHSKIYGNIAKVHRIPTFTDLYYVSKTEQGNPDLKPENAISSEFGYRFQNKNILAKASGFIRNSDNAIDWIKASPNAIWTAQNVGEIKMKGIEAEFKQNLNSRLHYSLGYTFLENNYVGKDNQLSKYVLENLKHQFVATLGTRILDNLNNELIYHYCERVSMGSYHLLDEKLSFSLNKFGIYLLVNNLTNTNYTETFGISMPKRWFHIGFSYDIRGK